MRWLWMLAVAPMCAAELDVMPMPAKVAGEARITIGQALRVSFTGYTEPRLSRAVERIPRGGQLVIHCAGPGAAVQKLGEDESYRLEVGAGGAKLDAAQPLGVLRGLETFAQLVAAGQAAIVEDRPRFPWRGLHLDVARHWMPLEVVERTLDGMAVVKLNVFHWHLSDDQGFRVESKRFPKLHELGSDGLFYTQEQVRDVIAYARDRGIRVVPEFDMPGHSTSWLVGYPELASAPGPYEIGRHWGIFDPVMDPTKESTYRFLDGFLGEMAALFPDEFFHIGGDEVNGRQWKRLQESKTPHELQAYFNKRVQAIVKKYGKRMEGWDEILNPDLPKDIVIQSWRGQKSLAEAARLGYQGILSSGYYLDLMQPAAFHYAVDPLGNEAANLSDVEKARILGGEAAMWTEFADPQNIDQRIWPRAAAIAERLWSPREVNDTASMYRRLEIVSQELERAGLTHRASYRTMLERLAGGAPVRPLEMLADVVEPVKLYYRARTKKYTQQTPLDRLVDAANPESARAREFAALVENGDNARTREWLALWRDNDAQLAPLIEKSPVLRETAPLSQDVSRLGSIGLQALGYADTGKRAPEAWLREQRAFLEDAAKPRAELLIAIVPSIEKLLNRAAATATPR